MTTSSYNSRTVRVTPWRQYIRDSSETHEAVSSFDVRQNSSSGHVLPSIAKSPNTRWRPATCLHEARSTCQFSQFSSLLILVTITSRARYILKGRKVIGRFILDVRSWRPFKNVRTASMRLSGRTFFWFDCQFRIFLRFFVVTVGLLSFQLMHGNAQEGRAAVDAEEQSNQTHSLSTTEESSQNEQTDKANTKPKSKQDARGGIVIAPIPISSPAIGSGVVLFGGYIFPLRRSDKTSPPSTVAGAVIITDNGTRGFALAGELFFKENSYHVTSGYFRGNINYDFYGVGLDAGTTAQKQPLKQDGQAFLGEFLYRPRWKFFLGPRLLAGNSLITLRTETKGEVPPPPDAGIRTQLTGLGFRLNRDTRLNRFYPEQGTFLDFTAMFFSVALGSKYSFEPYRFTFNGYKGLSSKQVLAYNVYACATSGKPPFYGECIFGTNNELRGYVGGQHIDLFMIATQLEYRLALPWRLGVVAFGGLGEVAPTVDKFRYDNLLPAVGGGLRIKLSKKYGVNLRADVARGRDGHTFSLGIGEAF